MSWTNLPTNFKNLVWSGLKKFNQIDNQDGTVSFEDVTNYQDTEGTQMTAAQLNQMTGAVNDMMNGELFIGDAPADGEEYVRKNHNWSIATGGGGGGSAPEAITVYVDGTNGSDSNSGSAEHPFATVEKAVSKVPEGFNGISEIYIAAGSYLTKFDINNKTIWFRLQGNVTLGGISLYHSFVCVIGETLTLGTTLGINGDSYFYQACPMVITTQYNCISVSASRFVHYSGSLTLTSTGSGQYAVSATLSSLVYLSYLSVTAETGIHASSGSIVAYETLTGTMTTRYVEVTGGRVFSGSGGGGGGSTVWGGISGTLADQTDLQNALDGKAAANHNHDAAYSAIGHTHDDRYYTEAETDALLADKADSADLGALADHDTVDYATEVTNKPILGTMSAVDDAPSNGSEYVRKNGAWSVASGGGGGAAWGSITGTLSNQTDLATALSAKADTANLGTIAGANYTISTTDLIAGTSPLATGDLYFYYEV